MGGPITALETLDSDWSVHKFIEVNFSKLTGNNQIFRNYFDYIHYHLCKISQIEFKFFTTYDFHEMNYITTYSMVICGSIKYCLNKIEQKKRRLNLYHENEFKRNV